MIQHSAVVRVGAPLLLSVLVACAADAPSPATFGKGIAALGAKLTLLADTFKFTEGPAADKQGNVFFTDQPNNRIWEWSVDGQLSIFLNDSGRANGMSFDQSGNLYACADLNNQLWEIDPATKKVTVLVKDYDGKKLNGPNDVWVRPDGGIYFTDKKLFVEMGSDGMTMDDEGNIYLTGKGVTVFNAEGEKIDSIPIDKPWTGNVKFGGKERDTLFITASDSLYSLRTRVHGTR